MLLLLACATPSPLVGDTLTEAGSWRLFLGSTTYDQGSNILELSAFLVEEEAAVPDLDIFLRPDMPEMAHSLDLVDFVEREPGLYTAELLFDMAGLWTLTGYASLLEQTEAFTFVVEVTP
jgi:hypothetical protein